MTVKVKIISKNKYCQNKMKICKMIIKTYSNNWMFVKENNKTKQNKLRNFNKK